MRLGLTKEAPAAAAVAELEAAVGRWGVPGSLLAIGVGGHPHWKKLSLLGLGSPGPGFLNSSWRRVEKGVKPRLDDRIAFARRFLQPWAV